MDPFRSPATYDWCYSNVRFKASHNSYDREEQPVVTQLPWNRESPSERGCRGLELDLQQSPDGRAWSIAHGGGYSAEPQLQLSEYFRLLREFSEANPEHDVVTVTLDLKAVTTDAATFARNLDSYVKRHLGDDRLYRPAELQGLGDDLVMGAMVNGWPTLGKLRGKFILCLSGDKPTKAAYAARGQQSLCFADLDISDADEIPWTGSGSCVFLNIDWNITPLDESGIRMLQHFAGQRGFVTRVYVIDDPGRWWKATVARANILTTNKVCRHWWARVGDSPFTRLVEVSV
jgi:hypothetical protein